MVNTVVNETTASRNLTAGPDSGPVDPFPIKLSGKIVKGFGRGSRELGIPTANIPISGLDVGGHSDIRSGVYFGFAGLDFSTTKNDVGEGTDKPLPSQPTVYQMVMSIGWNPYYKNEKRSVEVHLLHDFGRDLYESLMNITILGFIRNEEDYDSVETLIADIRGDIHVSRKSLQRQAYAGVGSDPFLLDFGWHNS